MDKPVILELSLQFAQLKNVSNLRRNICTIVFDIYFLKELNLSQFYCCSLTFSKAPFYHDLIIKLPHFFFRNILIDKPSDQTSRWSTDNDNHPQVKSLIYCKFFF